MRLQTPLLASIPLGRLIMTPEHADCPFCKRIDAHEYDFEGYGGVSFEPLNPVTPGHRLFVSVTHIEDASEAPFAACGAFELAAHYAAEQKKSFNLITSGGAPATQTVFHFHVHYIPRSPGDGLHLPWTIHD